MATKVIKATLRFKRGTAAEWASVNPVLKLAEPGYVTDLNKIKVGNGEDTWSELPYLTGSGSTSIAADNNSLEIFLQDEIPTIRIKDFNEAEAGDIPLKGTNNKIQWVNITETVEEIVEEKTYTKTEINSKLLLKQDKLTAGENITISENNVISASGGGSPTAITEAEIREICV